MLFKKQYLGDKKLNNTVRSFFSMKHRRFFLAIFVVAPSFIIIGLMYHTQQSTSTETIDTIHKLIEKNATDTPTITAVGEIFDDINTSNQTFFNILLAVFAAWVGTIIAFYFGSENLQQAQQTLRDSLTAKQQLSKKTIENLLGELDEATNVISVTMEDKIIDVRKKLQESTNVVVVNAKDKGLPIGVLYRWDLAKQAKVNIYADYTQDEKEINEKKSTVEKLKTKAENAQKDSDNDDTNNKDMKTKAENAQNEYDKASEEVKTAEDKLNKKKGIDDKELREIIESIDKEFITGKSWSKTEGIKNFAILDPALNLLQAKEKMDKLAASEKMLLSVRGFVIEANKSKIRAIINFANLTRGLF